jgi:putative transposase
MRAFVSCHIHCVFTTKHRAAWLTPQVRDCLWPYLGGIAREHKMVVRSVGGVADHVHMLVSLPSTMSIAKAMQVMKGNSSKWVSETFPDMREFAWQGGYGAFSIGISGIGATIEYINKQEEHHRGKSFRNEFVLMLRKHGIPFEEWMLEDDAVVGG